jgi:hypothetical protein
MIGYTFTVSFKLGDLVRLSDYYINRFDLNFDYDCTYSIWKVIAIDFKVSLENGKLPDSLQTSKNSNFFKCNLATPARYTIERVIRRNPLTGEILSEPQQDIAIMRDMAEYELQFANSPEEISVIEQFKRQNKNNFVD